jgi:hypothetical protein
VTARDTLSTQRRLFPFIAIIALGAAGSGVATYLHDHRHIPLSTVRTDKALATLGWSPDVPTRLSPIGAAH